MNHSVEVQTLEILILFAPSRQFMTQQKSYSFPHRLSIITCTVVEESYLKDFVCPFSKNTFRTFGIRAMTCAAFNIWSILKRYSWTFESHLQAHSEDMWKYYFGNIMNIVLVGHFSCFVIIPSQLKSLHCGWTAENIETVVIFWSCGILIKFNTL